VATGPNNDGSRFWVTLTKTAQFQGAHAATLPFLEIIGVSGQDCFHERMGAWASDTYRPRERNSDFNGVSLSLPVCQAAQLGTPFNVLGPLFVRQDGGGKPGY
jgi:hypothetical protein